MGGERGLLVFKLTILRSKSRAGHRIGSASFIFFDHFSVILQSHLKYRAGVDFVSGMGEARD